MSLLSPSIQKLHVPDASWMHYQILSCSADVSEVAISVLRVLWPGVPLDLCLLYRRRDPLSIKPMVATELCDVPCSWPGNTIPCHWLQTIGRIDKHQPHRQPASIYLLEHSAQRHTTIQGKIALQSKLRGSSDASGKKQRLHGKAAEGVAFEELHAGGGRTEAARLFFELLVLQSRKKVCYSTSLTYISEASNAVRSAHLLAFPLKRCSND